MATYPQFGSTQLDPRIAGDSAPAQQDGIVDELSKGYRRGLRGAGSSLAELAGAGAEALGATEVASGARRVAGSLREAAGAPELAPSVRSIRDVDSVGSGLRWGAGMMGEMTPVLAAAVAGGALTKNPMVGGTIAMAPFEAGDIASRQDKTQGTAGSRLAEAAGGGLASAVVGNVLPTHIMGKFGKGLRGDSSFLPAMGKNIAEGAGVGAVSEAGNEGVKQFASRQEFDTEAITEAGLGGAAFGGAFGVPAGVASYAKGNAESIGKTATALKDKGMELGGKIKDKAQSKLEDEGIDLGAAFDKGTDLVKRGRTKVDESVDRVINGQPLGDTLKEFATATGDRAKEIMDLSAEEKGKKVREWATKMADDAGFNADKREAVIQAAQKTGDRAAEITIATAKKAYDAAKRAREQLKEFANSFPASMENGKLKAGEHPASFNHDSIIDVEARKKSEDMSGPKKVVLEALRESGLMESRPDLFDHTDNINALASTLSKTMQQLAKGPLTPRQLKGLTRVLGDDTMPTLSALRRAVLTDADTENFFKNVSAVSEAKRRSDEFHKQIKTLMTPEALAIYEKAGFNLGELEDQLVGDARRAGGESTFGNIAMNNVSKEAYRTFFGPKADAAMTLTEKYAKQAYKDPAQLDMLPESKKLLKRPAATARDDTPTRIDEGGAEVEASEGGFDESGKRVEKENVDRFEFGLDATREDGGKRRKLGGRRYNENLPDEKAKLDQHLKDVQEDYPEYNVRVEGGRIVGERNAEEVKIGVESQERMRFERGRTAGKTAVKIGKTNYDAVRITREMMGEIKDSGLPSNVKAARAFFEGVARLADASPDASKLDIPDSTVIAYFGERAFTYGQAKRVTANTAEDRMSAEGKAALEVLRKEYRERGDSPGLQKRLQKLLDYERDKELTGGEDTQERSMDRAKKRAGGLPADQAGPREQRSTAAEPRSRADSQMRRRQAQYNAGEDVDVYADRAGNNIYDEEGNLTAAGVQEWLSGEAHGGINPRDQGDKRDRPRRSYDAEQRGEADTPRGRLRQRNRDTQDIADTEFRSYFKNRVEEGGRGRQELGKDENIHMVAASGQDMVPRSNMDGSAHFVQSNVSKAEWKQRNSLANTFDEWKDVDSEPVRRLTARGEALLRNVDAMSTKDKREFFKVAEKFPSEAMETINRLAKTYASAFVTPGATIAPTGKPTPNAAKATTVQTLSDKGVTIGKPRSGDQDTKSSVTLTPDIAARGKRRADAEHGLTADGFVPNKLYGEFRAPQSADRRAETAAGRAKLKEEGDRIRNGPSASTEKELLRKLEYLNNPPPDYTTAMARSIVATSKKELAVSTDEDARTLLRQIIKKGESVLDGDASLETLEGRPDPKVVAAKKAAFLERAASGDEGLIRELRTTDDAKGLQRALAVLPDGAARDAATQRMSELVKDDSVAYQLQTRKYSLVGVGIHNDLNKPGFPATHDSPIRHEGKFDWRKHKGKGEGNAAFGAGTYLSTAEGVHKSYKNKFTADARAERIRASGLRGYDSQLFDEDLLQEAAQRLEAMDGQQWVITKDVNGYPHYQLGKDKDGFFTITKELNGPLFGEGNYSLRYYTARAKKSTLLNYGKTPEWLTANMPSAKQLAEAAKVAEKSPTYEVSVNIEPHQILNWDKLLADQPDMLKLLEDDTEVKKGIEKEWDRRFARPDDLVDLTGEDVYRVLTQHLGSQRAASEYLQSKGILGHKFNAAGGKNDKYPNYVIYDDSKIETNYVHFSQGRVDPNATGPVNKQAVEEHINKVLGNSVRVFWPTFSVMPWAGDYTHVQKLIRISVQSLNPMSVAYHESMHAFVANLRDMGATDVVAALEKAANSPHNITQVREFFKNEPEVLKQLSDPEERVAYMYQLWAAGQLTPNPGARTVFQKIAAFFRKILGQWSNDQRAEHIMEYFNSGEYGKNMASPNAVRRALMSPGRNKAYETAAGFTKGLADLADTLFTTGSARVRETGVPALQDIADAVKRQGKDTRGGTRGFVQASRLAATKLRSEFAGRLDEHVTADHLREAIEALQTNTRAPSPEARNTVRAVRAQLKEARQYMLDAGAYVGDLGPEYFPRVWDVHYISKNQKAFRDMLEPYVRSGALKGDVDKLIKKLVASEGHEFSVETDMPGMQFTKQRILGFITDADAAGFLEKDLMETMHSYLTQAARRAEWFRLFGNGKLDALMSRARKEGATKEQIETTEQYLKGINGTLGDNISPALRRLYGNTIVYQNVRLLPLAVFSSLVDPMGIVVRGGTVRDAWSTFTKGIREIPLSFKKKSQKPGQAEEIAELVGVIDSAMLNHITSDMYTQGMVGGTAKKINNAFFKYNMMEGLNRSYRVGATAAALKFIAKHADGTASRHSKRWIKELGLDPSDVVKYKDRIALTQAEGLSPEAEVRLHAAINQWVDGAVLRPDAADKPIWMNDPHYAIFSHLKQFIYSFQKTIIERTVHEFKNGNYTPAMALASYVPMMIASDFIKGMIQGGGSQPEWKAGWGPVEYVGYGVQRAGLLGVGQFGVDAYENMSRGGLGVTALGGPAIEQLVDVLGTLSGRNQFGDVALDALPANALYSEAIGPGR